MLEPHGPLRFWFAPRWAWGAWFLLAACSSDAGGSANRDGNGDTTSSEAESQDSNDGASQCNADLGADEMCDAQTDWSHSCGLASDREATIQHCLLSDGPLFDRYDPCLLKELIDCFDLSCDADLTQCQMESIVATHPGLVDLEAEAECRETTWARTGTGEEPQACIDRHGGRLRECADAARSCDLSYNQCLNASLLRDEYLPEVDACVAGPCDGFLECLRTATFGE